MSSNLQEEVSDLSELAGAISASTDASPDEPLSDKVGALDQHLSGLIRQIPKPLQKAVLHILIELHHLLRHLDLIEHDIRQERDLRRVVQLFEVIYGRANSLKGKTKILAEQLSEDDETLRHTLEGISFTLRHEIGRAFVGDMPAMKSIESGNLSRSELARSHGILQNCFQQSTIVLAQVFDPTLDGETIFEDYRVRQEQSVILRRELTSLLQKLRWVEEEFGMLSRLYLINSLRQFQRETMHFLMHRDWEEFDGFVNEIVNTYDDMGNLSPVLHRFSSYLEILLSHVGMRAVFNNQPSSEADMMINLHHGQMATEEDVQQVLL